MAVRTPRVSLLTLPWRSPRARCSRSPKLASKEPIASCFKVGNGETLEERCRPSATRWKIVVRSALELTHEPGGDHLSATKLGPVRSDGSTLARRRHPGAPVTLRMLGQGHRRTGNLRTGRGLETRFVVRSGKRRDYGSEPDRRLHCLVMRVAPSIAVARRSSVCLILFSNQ